MYSVLSLVGLLVYTFVVFCTNEHKFPKLRICICYTYVVFLVLWEMSVVCLVKYGYTFVVFYTYCIYRLYILYTIVVSECYYTYVVFIHLCRVIV